MQEMCIFEANSILINFRAIYFNHTFRDLLYTPF